MVALAEKQPVTDRQRQVLDIIVGYLASHGRPPTLRDLQFALKIKSPNGILGHVNSLVRKGLLRRDSLSRGMFPVLPEGPRLVRTETGAALVTSARATALTREQLLELAEAAERLALEM